MIKHATKIILAILSMSLLVTTGEARPRHHHARAVHGLVVCNRLGCSDRPHSAEAVESASAYDANGNGALVGRRPAGCPYEYCGCEASLYVFGKIRRDLNAARNWRIMFPRAAAAPGMAAVRTHHVMILMSHVSGSNWLVHDGNFNHQTLEHVVSIRGYTVVDPHGSPAEALTAQASYRGY
ncbi:MAG TPA: hypothetical protein VE224_05225 [Pseudolabrys sp.]|nr:hypothetical protein [Pseudolabrys sp.]